MLPCTVLNSVHLMLCGGWYPLIDYVLSSQSLQLYFKKIIWLHDGWYVSSSILATLSEVWEFEDIYERQDSIVVRVLPWMRETKIQIPAGNYLTSRGLWGKDPQMLHLLPQNIRVTRTMRITLAWTSPGLRKCCGTRII